MIHNTSIGARLFNAANIVFLGLISLLCLLPFVHVVAVSLSSSASALSGEVLFWPVDFTFRSYEFALARPNFLLSIRNSFERVVIGVILNMLLTLLVAYPLSKETNKLRLRTLYAWIFVFTMIFNGGLIPMYMLLRNMHLLDTVGALVFPSAVNVFNVVLLINFFRGLPKELEDSASIDGAGHWTILWRIFVPLSAPALATLLLFTIVFHWNSWFDGLIFMNSPEHYPLQSYLQTLVFNKDPALLTTNDLDLLRKVSDRTVKSAQIFLGALPVLIIYPFLQRFFMHGIVLGSVKE